FDDGFRCTVPEGLPIGEQLDVFLSLQFSDVDVELQAKLPLGDEQTRENYVKDTRGAFALTTYRIERDSREFFRVARRAFEVSEPMFCVVDQEHYDDHLRKGYIRIRGAGFQPLHQQSYVPEVECLYTESRILDFCDGKLPEIHEALQADATCREYYHKRRTARTRAVVQNRGVIHCPLPEDRAVQGEVLLQLAEKHRPNSLVVCTTQDPFKPASFQERVELPQLQPLHIQVTYEAKMSTYPEHVLFRGAAGGYVKVQVDTVPPTYNYTTMNGTTATGFSRLLNNKCVWWESNYDSIFLEDE
ncbi:unnamed protein product, partial [Amoebophrya sp. A25]